MYLPRPFEETRPDILRAFIRENPLGTLVVMTENGLDANHIPFEFDPEPAPHGTLHGHVARSNPVWRQFSPAIEALVVFHGPQSYVSPSWYPTKQETGQAVPTWNYIVVHARGPLRAIDDSPRVRAHLEQLTAHHEAGRPHPWHIADAPADYVSKQIGQIIAIEIPLSQLVGKWKVSQNRVERDRIGTAQGLLEEKRPGSDAMAAAISKTLDERG
jgi:transcriptional regulator